MRRGHSDVDMICLQSFIKGAAKQIQLIARTEERRICQIITGLTESLEKANLK
jgi:hypothetical protein